MNAKVKLSDALASIKKGRLQEQAKTTQETSAELDRLRAENSTLRASAAKAALPPKPAATTTAAAPASKPTAAKPRPIAELSGLARASAFFAKQEK